MRLGRVHPVSEFRRGTRHVLQWLTVGQQDDENAVGGQSVQFDPRTDERHRTDVVSDI